MYELYSKCQSTQGFSRELYTQVNAELKLSKEKPEGYKRVLIAPYIRTMRDNLVVVQEGFISPISSATVISQGLYPTYLFDTGLICCKNYMESVFVAKNEEAMMRIIKNSTCFPVGAVEIYDIVVSFNIIVSDDLFRDPEIALSDGFTLYPIEVYHPEDIIQQELAKSLVLVKAEGGNK